MACQPKALPTTDYDPNNLACPLYNQSELPRKKRVLNKNHLLTLHYDTFQILGRLTLVLNAWHHQFLCNMTSCFWGWPLTCGHDVITFRRSRSGKRLSKPPYYCSHTNTQSPNTKCALPKTPTWFYDRIPFFTDGDQIDCDKSYGLIQREIICYNALHWVVYRNITAERIADDCSNWWAYYSSSFLYL